MRRTLKIYPGLARKSKRNNELVMCSDIATVLDSTETDSDETKRIARGGFIGEYTQELVRNEGSKTRH